MCRAEAHTKLQQLASKTLTGARLQPEIGPRTDRFAEAAMAQEPAPWLQSAGRIAAVCLALRYTPHWGLKRRLRWDGADTWLANLVLFLFCCVVVGAGRGDLTLSVFMFVFGISQRISDRQPLQFITCPVLC